METRPWLKNYDNGVPKTLEPYPEKTILDVVSEAVKERPDSPVLLFKGASMSWGELELLSDAFANALIASGVKKGDRLALLLLNSPQFLIAQLGGFKAGAIVSPINPLYTERELEHALNECEAETIVVLTLFYDKVKAIQEKTKLCTVIATNIKEYLPPFLRILFTLLREKKEGHRINLQPGDYWFTDWINEYSGSPKPEIKIRPEDPALLLFSGGTTGTPKGVVGSHHALIITPMQVFSWFSDTLNEWEDVVLLPIPLFHVYANVGALGTGLLARMPIALVPNPRDLDDLVGTIKKVRPAFLPGVPTLFIALLNHPDVQSGKVDFESMNLCISAAAPLLHETKQRFETLTGGHMIEAYGLTESMLAAVFTPIHGEYKPGAVGLPLPDVDIRVVDPDTGEKLLPTGEVGEILVKGYQLMKGYWKRPTETANTIRDGWLYTGDLGYLDEDGYLYIVDRKKDVIKPSGFQVWPRDVEEVIASHPAIAEVGVAGVPDEYQGEAVKAWVVVNEGESVTEDELRAFCREQLTPYKVPKHIEFRDSLPKTMVGKVLRRELVSEEN
jgi:long-chain acyl-CoA synthetase